MMTFTGWVGPTSDVGPTAFPAEQSGDWAAACPLWVSGAGIWDWQRHVAAPDVVVDVFGFSPASGDQVCSTAREFARSGDLMVLDAIATGSGVLVVREPQRVTVLTDLAGVWPVFYATVGESVMYSSSAAAVARYAGSEVDEQWLATRLLAGGIPDAWSEGSPYRRVAVVPAGGALLIDRRGRAAVVRRELPLGTAGFGEGARRLAEALTSAVLGRSSACPELSTDLSGGLDSSTVAALAAATRPDPRLPAVTLVCTDLDSDDPAHARRVAAAMPGIKQFELPLPREVEPYSLGDGAALGDVASLGMVQTYGRAHRIHLELAAGRGVALHAPYLDDAVVAACLAVPAAERASPRQAKPLLRAAMTGRVPDAALVRSTKGDYSMLAYRGLSRHHRTVADLLTNSRLAGLGLIEEKVIRADLARGAAGLPISLAALDQVLGAELWLRTGCTASVTTVAVTTDDRRQRAHA